MIDPSIQGFATEHFLDVGGRNRFAEMIALHFIAVVLAQEGHLIVRLDALGNDPQIQILTQ